MDRMKSFYIALMNIRFDKLQTFHTTYARKGEIYMSILNEKIGIKDYRR